jgi:hypothetical protein
MTFIPEDRAQIIADLRTLLDFLEAHPDVPIDPFSARISFCVREKDDADGTAAVEAVAKSLGVEVDRDAHVTAERVFGCATYRVFYNPRELTWRFGSPEAVRRSGPPWRRSAPSGDLPTSRNRTSPTATADSGSTSAWS